MNILTVASLARFFLFLSRSSRPGSSWRQPVLKAGRIAAALLALAACARAAEMEWPHWRGPNFNGGIETGQYPTAWDAKNIEAQGGWKVQLPGKGTSTPIVHQERIYLTCPDAGEDAVLAYDWKGQLLWKKKLGSEAPPKHRTLASSGNASPVTDGKAIFVYFKSGNFAALELNGKVRWQINIVERFGKDQLFWDQGSSPVVTDQFVILPRLHQGESWVAAFDKQTGELRWKQPRNYQVPLENDNGYTTPVFFQQGGTQAFLIWGADHLTAHNAESGAQIWSCGGFNPKSMDYWPAIATPVVVGDVAVVPVGRDDRSGQASLHAVKLGGKGEVTGTHRLWTRPDTGVFVATPAVYKGRVYILRHRGEVVCIDPANGRTIWSGAFPEHRAPYYSSPVIANGVLYAAREDGVVFAARVENKFEQLSENPMGERLIACVVPAGNRLFLRGDNHLFCIAKN